MKPAKITASPPFCSISVLLQSLVLNQASVCEFGLVQHRQVGLFFLFLFVFFLPSFLILTHWFLILPNDKVWSCCSSHTLPLCLFVEMLYFGIVLYTFIYICFLFFVFLCLFFVGMAFCSWLMRLSVLYSVPSLAFGGMKLYMVLFKPNTVSPTLCFLL